MAGTKSRVLSIVLAGIMILAAIIIGTGRSILSGEANPDYPIVKAVAKICNLEEPSSPIIYSVSAVEQATIELIE
ncbi:MAG: hypothetical protein LBC56_05380 [Oscillospiraceae bacterium]|jgi:hypothetical protein|nr:hypothetical protein [Oscillospiraceae bacterium]